MREMLAGFMAMADNEEVAPSTGLEVERFIRPPDPSRRGSFPPGSSRGLRDCLSCDAWSCPTAVLREVIPAGRVAIPAREAVG